MSGLAAISQVRANYTLTQNKKFTQESASKDTGSKDVDQKNKETYRILIDQHIYEEPPSLAKQDVATLAEKVDWNLPFATDSNDLYRQYLIEVEAVLVKELRFGGETSPIEKTSYVALALTSLFNASTNINMSIKAPQTDLSQQKKKSSPLSI
jgi:hypothetical protein